MIAVYSQSKVFNSFVESCVSKIGIIPFFFTDTAELDFFESTEPTNFLVFFDGSSRVQAESVCEILCKKFPLSRITVAVNNDSELLTRFKVIEGIDRQITFPCDEQIFCQMLLKYFSFTNSFGILKFGQRQRKLTLLGYPLSLSKTDYAIVKLLVNSGSKAIPSDKLSSFLKLSENCLSVHVCNINKKAFALTNRKLIIFKKHGYLLNPTM